MTITQEKDHNTYYVYDTWGKVLSVSGSLASTVGVKNPIRYRGYYYDTETELYYLSSRYYDPEVGRFISPDVVAEGGNLYAYCANDPVNRSDESGYMSDVWKKRLIVMGIAVGVVLTVIAVTAATGGSVLPVIIGAITSGAINGGLSVANQLESNEKFEWGKLATDFCIGAALGAFGGSAIGAGGMAIASGIMGAGSSIANDWIDGRAIDYKKAALSGCIGAMLGYASGGGAQKGLTGARQAALQTKKQIIQRKRAGGYRSENNYKFGKRSNAGRIDRVTKILNREAVINIFESYTVLLEPTVYQSLLFS